MATGKRRSLAQIARDRLRISDLYLQGWIQADIADELEVDQSTISRDLKALHQEWLDSSLINFDEAKAGELAKIDRLEREAWREYERSRFDKESVVTEKVQNENSTRDKAQVKKEGRLGDPRYLGTVQWCIEQRCKVLGVYSAVKHEHMGEGGGPIGLVILPAKDDND